MAVNPRVRGPSRPVPAKAARKTHVIVISSDSEEEQDKAEAEFLAVASHIRLPIRLHVHKHLPFLRRNLRRSFMQTCSALGVASRAPGKPQYPIEYVYRYKLSDFTSVTYNYLNAPTWTEYRELVTEWRCAFCDLLGELSSQEMLSLHLRRDHSDVASTEWTDIDGRIKISMTLLPPQRDEEPVDTSDDEYDIQEPEIHIDIASREHQAGTQIKREPLFLPDSSPEPEDSEATPTMTASTTAASEEPSFHPSATASEEPSFRSSATVSTPSAPTIKLKHELDNERLRYRDEGAPRQPRTGLTADGRLLPPPKDDPQGPAAEPPLDSCRPGGPRIYDLLNELPLEPYGVLAWSIVDREEEIYELVDVRDEDKVVLALWNRWIFFNRMQFNLNGYRNGVEAFLTDNYQMIHRAAGWTALRSFLLVLAANRFLNLREVLKCLAHYDKKVEDDLVQLEA
ncbi:hypothetical protein PHLGIDRAFT_114212 [Phlebiopsis gigantea 11061_1 CR5-6]|uniref:Uncharacterized protein n=1 Tax=Phlebiopsis gigantea (strain 11061_1 CR5-6) TaxID=745531 RepID=A0A0C3SFD6_PHLG1|nr:hypothetical protein PHLGIDRAFT_114212 [Phlebiopsis gigantea 11061_1 CR5-6]